jgi:RAB6A-GEF complex partner protein 2
MHSGQQRAISPRPPEGWSGALSNLNPISRVMSESSTAGTPRTSSEFYSMSNHSDETLTSEVPYQNGRLLPKPSHSRQVSSAKHSPKRPSEPETLMMAYAQTMGYFVLDGSLVNAAPFEEVKRKGVQGGGGVVGIERAKRSSGMFGAFSWGNIGESLGGLLGADDMSSMAQMKANAGSRNIPLLATPQSLLFVDLRLAPGESKSYNYKFHVPRGLPPSYRGRAIKVFYHLALGVQRPEGQAIKTVEVPFRILGSYNSRGETLGHDLMSPYILLQDAARSKSIEQGPSTPLEFPKFEPKATSNTPKSPKQGLEDFLRYTERLLTENEDGQGILASPTSPTTSSFLRKESIAEQSTANVKDAVDFAILRANYVTSSSKQRQPEAQSANRFNIARGGQPVAVLTLLRPAYRLGEAVIGTIDFTAPVSALRAPAHSPTYAVVAELESAERVDPSLALRSSNSINRVTRKVQAAVRENTLFSRQVSFSLTIPATATPTFETTGVSLVWRLRVEFTTERQAQGLGLGGAEEGENGELLEELGSDERGTTSIARERLLAETFEIEVPLKVFGTPGVEPVSVDGEGLEI